MAKITGPKKMNGWALGARFTDGVAESDHPTVLAVFSKLPNYKVEGSTPAGTESLDLEKPEEDGEDA